VLLRAGAHNTFVAQLGLAVGLAGQGLFAAGVLAGGFALAGGPGSKFEASQFALIAAFEAALVAAAPVVVHRCLCVLGAAVALGGAAVVLEATALYVPLVALLFALAGSLCVADGARAGLWQACAVGLALALLASIAVLVAEPNFIALGRRMPRPAVPEWIGAAAMSVVFAAVVAQLLRATEVSPTSRTGAAICALAAALIVVTWPVSGLLAAVVALVVAFAIGHEVLTGLGVAVLLAALARYYFGLEAPLLVKSAALCGTGVVLLAGWYALRRVAPVRTEAGRA
jgi:hypothetical protein